MKPSSKQTKKKMNEAEFQKLFGQRLRYFRNQQNLTQEQLVEKANMSGVNYLSELERGKRSPRTDLLLRISHALNIEVYQLFQIDSGDISVINKSTARKRLADLDQLIDQTIQDTKSLKRKSSDFLKTLLED